MMARFPGRWCCRIPSHLPNSFHTAFKALHSVLPLKSFNSLKWTALGFWRASMTPCLFYPCIMPSIFLPPKDFYSWPCPKFGKNWISEQPRDLRWSFLVAAPISNQRLQTELAIFISDSEFFYSYSYSIQYIISTNPVKNFLFFLVL